MSVFQNITKSPITTILGLLGGALVAVSQQNLTSWKAILTAIVVALLGAIAKEK